MSLRIRKIGINGFRKFREPVAIDGLSDGLNIVIEPNETGKSTLLEALRAAFFVRHNTRNQLAQSFAPHGEAVGPEIQVAFDVDDSPWVVTKRFLRSPSVDVTGPQGKAQGEEAESRLNTLLGAVRDTSRGGDVSSYGALGLLWVAQAEALSVSEPGQIVRDAISSSLEAEVGAIMGGAAYRQVRERIDAQYEHYWTPTGQKRGRQNQAHEHVAAAESAARDASDRLAALERSFTELEAARARLKIIQREMADDTDPQARTDLVASLEVARVAAQILATRRAEQDSANGKLNSLEDLLRRHRQADAAREGAARALADVRRQRVSLAETLNQGRQKVADSRIALELARVGRKNAREALAAGEDRLGQTRRRASIDAARKRHGELITLETQYREAKALAATAISAALIASLEAHDRAVAEAHAIVNAGATRIALSGAAEGVTIDGNPMLTGERTLTREVRIRFGDAELLVSPPASAASAEEALASALRRQQGALEELGVADLRAARERNELAREATADLRTLEARIEVATPADEIIHLAAGAEALKLFVGELGEIEEAPEDVPDINGLKHVMDAADTTLARAEGVQDGAIEALRRMEEEDAPLATAEAGAASNLAHASTSLEAIESRLEWVGILENIDRARQQAAEASVRLEEAVRNASAHDIATITRKIELIDARARTAAETRTRLETDIARVEGTVESEGGVGLADRAAAAREEADAARAKLQRITEEADTLKLLRDTLDAARDETSRKFVGPVIRCAKRHIERLLPGCDLTFSESLALESVIREGVDESCTSLSRGTQEQLAVLTRIAFADMLLEQGKPVSLILDDPLVYSDDARLDLMLEILGEAATRMQVILLTCRDRAFRHIDANRINLPLTSR
ncbi:AAA family ATPase [Paraburkholderia hospita]|uniref:AAA family ATPase n=1 Tax=Paraburkholderia hospita TaxID=169430 RepID=UPI003ECCB966